MNNIVKRENQSVNIDRLDAQRHLYSKAKTYTYLVVILCVLNPVLLAIAKVVFPKMDVLVKITVVYSFVIVFFKPLLNNCISKLQALAARIQQLFDCDVFELAWNEPLCGTKPAPEEVFKARTNKGIEEFRNWYEEAVVLLDRLPGIIVCQRTNVFYDRNLRNIYGKAVNVMFCIAFLLVFFIGFFQNPHLWDFFLKVIVPLSPIVSWMIDFKKQNKLSLSALKRLDSLVNIRHWINCIMVNKLMNRLLLRYKIIYFFIENHHIQCQILYMQSEGNLLRQLPITVWMKLLTN